MTKPIFKWTAFVMFCLAMATANACADQWTLNLSNGTVITVDADSDQTVPWETIAASGKSKSEPSRLGDIQRIILTDQPASMKIAKVRRLLDQLNADDYQLRQEAQVSLSEPTLGIPFQKLIEAERENESLEVRARVNLILKELKGAKKAKRPEFDFLHLKDGTVKRGDVGELVVKCTYRGQEINLKRENIRRLSKEPLRTPTTLADSPLAVEMIHKHEDKFFADPERFIDFESVEPSSETASKDLTNVFLDRGVTMDSDGLPFVGLSGYPIKYPDMPTGGESACVIDSSGLYRKRFEGSMQFSFCVPGLPDVPAGVNEFGLFLSRVDHPRDFILEAYNAESQLLGTTEATDEPCVFLGIRSNEPIAFIRVLSNPYLFEVNRKVDENYAIDNVWFGDPKPLPDALVARDTPGLNTVSLKNGEILSAEDLRFKEGTVEVYDEVLGRRIKISTDEISSIRFASNEEETGQLLRKPDPTSDDWLVMLKDRSILKVTPGETFTSELLGGELNKDEIMAVWSKRDQMRFPGKEDFTDAQHVLVFPTCRWQTEVAFSKAGASWQQGKQILQPVYPRLEREEAEAAKTGESIKDRREDVTPKFTSFQFDKRTESQMPTLWLSQPQLTSSKLGAIHLNDDQKIALNESGFTITTMTKRNVTLTGPADSPKSLKIPTSEIRAIRFPK